MGPKTRRWRRAALAGRLATGHEGSFKKNAQGRSQSIQALSPAHRPIMEPSLVAFDQNFSGAADDFPALLRRKGLLAPAAIVNSQGGTPHQKSWQPTEATTILAFKFSGGVLVAGDRRATAGNTVVYDRADKVLEIDRQSIMAIAGVPATAWEMARVLEHSFQYFRRTQLQEMSVDGKVRALSKLLRDNIGFVMQGVGVVVPIFATYDSHPKLEARLYFYDAMGAQFEVTDYAATGSGSPAVRGKRFLRFTTGSRWGRSAIRAISSDCEWRQLNWRAPRVSRDRPRMSPCAVSPIIRSVR